MNIVGYSDLLTVRPGQTIRFMVSSQAASYEATLVRLRHTDRNPAGPGFKTEPLESTFAGEYPGHEQAIQAGSYVEVPHNDTLTLSDGFTLEAWIYPTTPDSGTQGLVTRFSGTQGYGLMIDEDGSLALWLGNGTEIEKIGLGVPLLARHWYFVSASYDARHREATVQHKLLSQWPIQDKDVTVRAKVKSPMRCSGPAPLLMASSAHDLDTPQAPGSYFNGKIDNPRIYARAFPPPENPESSTLVASWDFSCDIATSLVRDTGPSAFHGRAVNLPTRAVTGHNWTGEVSDFKVAPAQYGAIHFHDDDLEDAGWDVAFEWSVPARWESGFYAVHLSTCEGEDYVPFIVTTESARAPIAFLAPTLSYLVYANQRFIDPIRASLELQESEESAPQDSYMREQGLLSCYDLHSDGSGVCYSSRLRPILNFRPGYVMPSRSLAASWPRHLNADLHLLDWLDAKGFDYDVISDDDLHREGAALLASYRVVLTGSHPEYWTGSMLNALESYQVQGGRLMYLGGNGFYWITTLDPERPHVAEVRRWRGTRVWEAAPGECHHSSTGEMGGLWRYRNRAAQKMVGVGFTSQGGGHNRPYRRLDDSFDARAGFIFEGIGRDEPIGDFPALVLEYGAAGFEIDRADRALGTPAHALVLATADGFTDLYQVAIEDQLVSTPNTGGSRNSLIRSDMVYYEGPGGGAVFSVGSISWCSCLSYNRGQNNVSRITENVLRRFTSDNSISG